MAHLRRGALRLYARTGTDDRRRLRLALQRFSVSHVAKTPGSVNLVQIRSQDHALLLVWIGTGQHGGGRFGLAGACHFANRLPLIVVTIW